MKQKESENFYWDDVRPDDYIYKENKDIEPSVEVLKELERLITSYGIEETIKILKTI